MFLVTSPEPLERGGLGGLRERGRRRRREGEEEGGGGGGRRRRREEEEGGGGGRRKEDIWQLSMSPLVCNYVYSCV